MSLSFTSVHHPQSLISVLCLPVHCLPIPHLSVSCLYYHLVLHLSAPHPPSFVSLSIVFLSNLSLSTIFPSFISLSTPSLSTTSLLCLSVPFPHLSVPYLLPIPIPLRPIRAKILVQSRLRTPLPALVPRGGSSAAASSLGRSGGGTGGDAASPGHGPGAAVPAVGSCRTSSSAHRSAWKKQELAGEVGPTMVGDEHSDPNLMQFLGATKRNMLGNHFWEYYVNDAPRIVLNKLESCGYRVVSMTGVGQTLVWCLHKE
ncbi:GTP cyclohydrolase 1 feedback regulatory protein isoform X2 [Numida meleagris]|nr:GTP cyclohydrolase 1 feedback regulatory protein isoform X2 [Numida meleagris]